MPYEQDMRKVRMQQMLAQMLQQQGRQGMQGTNADGRFVAPSRNASIAAALSQIGGGVLGAQSMKKEGELEDQRKAELAAQIAKMAGVGSAPAQAAQAQQPVMGFQPPTPREPTKTDLQQGKGNPRNQQMAEALAAIGSLPIEQHQQILSSQAMERLFPKPRNPERPIAVMDKDGNPVYAKESESYGLRPYSMVSQAQPSADIQSYEIAKTQGYKGTLLEFLQERASATAQPSYSMQNVAGAKGPMNTRTGEFAPISTLPQEAKAAATVAGAEASAKTLATGEAEKVLTAPQRAERVRQLTVSADGTIAQIDKALGDVGWSTTGFIGSIAKKIPQTAAYDLGQTLLTVKANIGFDRLQQMRDASPTGGALGQVAVQELDALQASIASLDQAQSSEQIADGLSKVRSHYEGWKNAVIKAQQDQRPSTGPSGLKKISSDEDYDALPSGAEFIDPEGKRRRKP